jgi:outer membrane autotransporter protein
VEGGTTISTQVPEDRYQLKLGVQGNLDKQWQLWMSVGGTIGDNDYRQYEGNIGMKYQW